MAEEVRLPAAGGDGEVRGLVDAPSSPPRAALVLTHGRSNDMRTPLLRRLAEAGAHAGVWALRINFRYVDEKGKATWDLSREERDLLGAVRFARVRVPSAAPVLVAGKSMGARVCARASGDADVAGVIALGYPLHPMFQPDVRDPPEWPLLVKPALFVQGDHDPFCDLGRLRGELPRLARPHELVVVPSAGHSFEPKGGARDTFPEVRDAVLAWIDRQTGP